MNPAILSVLIFFPFVAALFLALVPATLERVWRFAMYLAMGECLLAIKLAVLFNPAYGVFQMEEQAAWIPAFGISYIVGVDGISLWLVVLTAVLTPIVMLTARDSIKRQLRAYLVSMFLLEGAMMGSFLALDLILFFVFWELMLVPMAIIIGVWGGERRVYSAIKFFLYTAGGSALMLVSIISLAYLAYSHTDYLTFDYRMLRDIAIPPHLSLLLFLGFAIAFAIKVPLFPFHTWLPDAHTEAPTGGSVILAGILLKFGVYGYFRFCLPMFPDAALRAAPYLAGLGVIGIVYGALVTMVQTDFKRLIAYSSVSHLGFCMIGLFALTSEGMAGSLFVCLAHGVSTGALFLLVGFIYDRRHTRNIGEFGGITQVMPFYATAFVITALASAGLPGLCGFVGEFLSLAGLFLSQSLPYARIFTVIAATAVILSAVYLLWTVQRVFFGAITNDKNKSLTDLSLRERCAILPLLALMLWMGVYPETILARMRPTIDVLRAFVTLKIRHMDMHRLLPQDDASPLPAPYETPDPYQPQTANSGAAPRTGGRPS